MTISAHAGPRVRTALAAGASARALAAALLLLGAPAALAQTEEQPVVPAADAQNANADAATGDAQPGQTDEAAEGEDIVVTGFRSSLRTAIAVKRNLDVVAEVVSAEDIGRLPDVSIAESLARLPGVTSQRTGGQASAINIRGLSQDLVSATLNGREQVATSGNRTIEFDQYPSELINQAAVYKSPKASQIEGGVAGKVELTTARPLSLSGTVVSLNARGVYNDRAGQNPDADEFGYRVSGSIQTQLLDDTLGIAVGYARLRQANVATRFVGYDYTVTGTNGSPAPLDLDNNGRADSIGYGFEVIQAGGNETRDGVLATIQYEPGDTTRILIDGYYSRFDSKVFRRGLRFEGTQTASSNITDPTIVDNAIVGGTLTGGGLSTRTVQQNENRLDKLYTIGGNIQQDVGRVTLTGDASYSRATSFFNNSGLNSTTATATPLVLTYQLNGLNVGDFSTNADYTDPAANQFNGFYIVPQYDTDRLIAFAGSALVNIDGPFFKSFEIGGRYGDRRASRTITSFNGFDFATPVLLTSQNSSVAGFEGQFSGYPNFLVADIGRIFDEQLGADRVVDQTLGFTRDQSFTIDEKTWAGFAQINFDTVAGSLPFKGNLGLRAVRTDQSSSSTLDDGAGGRYDNTRGVKYWDWMPQANFILELTPDDQARLSFSRQISRPRFFDFRNSISTNLVAIGPTTARLDGSGGNPELRPFRANQVDATYEHYFGSSGSLVLGAFYKDIRSFIIGGVVPNYDFAANGITTPPLTGTQFTSVVTTGNLFAPINGEGGYVYGFEGALTKTFDFLPAPFDGLGAVLNISYNKSSVDIASTLSGNPVRLSLPGLSKIVSNPTIFYEKSGFSTRVGMRYRSKFVAPQFGLNEQIVTNAAETVFDAQMSYEFPESSALGGLTILAQANNFTDEPTRSYFGQTAQTGTLQYFGRQFYLGASFRF